MKQGRKVWYVPSLWEKAVPVTVIGIEYDVQGRPKWIVAEGKQGTVYSGYVNLFTTERPFRYTV